MEKLNPSGKAQRTPPMEKLNPSGKAQINYSSGKVQTTH
jgi:hypothetical protein